MTTTWTDVQNGYQNYKMLSKNKNVWVACSFTKIL